MGRRALDLLNDINDALGWPQLTTIEGDLSPFARKGLRALNRVLRTLAAIDDWFFLRAESEIITIAEYRVGVATVTNGSTTVTGADDPNTAAADPPVWTAAMEGRAINFGNDALIYRISKVNSATNLTLNRPYQGTTLTDGNYVIAQDRYELPTDFDRPIGDWTNFFSSQNLTIRPVSPNEFRDIRKRRNVGIETNDPQSFTAWGYDAQNEHRLIVLDPFPKDQQVLEFPYQTVHPEMSLDTHKVRFPLRYDPLLIEACIYILKRDIEDDARASQMLLDFLQEKNDALGKREVGEQMHRITPSNAHRLRERARWGSRSSRIDYGEHFDNINFYDLHGRGR